MSSLYENLETNLLLTWIDKNEALIKLIRSGSCSELLNNQDC